MTKIIELEPEKVWVFFTEICKIPRPSKKEEKIIEYLDQFSKKHNLVFKQDKAGNVLIKKDAAPGYENRKTVVLQSHLDMVGEKNAGTDHDFEQDAIQPYVENNRIKAKGTTLGADNGIGIAMQLAILADQSITHGPLECLFTVDEETGLTGAFALEGNFFTGSVLINLDSEDDGEIFIGCAGGIDSIAEYSYSLKKTKNRTISYLLAIKGLKGGHSGDDIHKGRANAVQLLGRFLWNAQREFNIRIATINGGNLRNAIPREASALFSVPVDFNDDLNTFVSLFRENCKNELYITEPGIEISLINKDRPQYWMDKKTQNRLISAVYSCPNGIINMSQEIDGLVETSTNLASVKMTDGLIRVVTSQRSSLESAKFNIASRIRSIFELSRANVKHSDGYPGWNPNTDSALLKTAKDSYEQLFGTEPKVRAIHAGLECGLFLEKYPQLDMISIGPQIDGAHSPDETLSIESTQKTWKHLLDILTRIPEESED